MNFFVSIKNVAGVTELNDECGGNDRWPYHMAFLDATSHCYGCTWNNKIMLRRDSVFMCSSMHFMNTCGTTAPGIITYNTNNYVDIKVYSSSYIALY